MSLLIKQLRISTSLLRSFRSKTSSVMAVFSMNRKYFCHYLKSFATQAHAYHDNSTESHKIDVKRNPEKPSPDPKERPIHSMISEFCKLDLSLIPEGLPKNLDSYFNDTKRSSLLVRKHDLELADKAKKWLSNRENKTQDSFILLDGCRGSGKSATIARFVEQRRKDGWIVIYIPEARAWTFGNGTYNATYENRDWLQGEPLFYDRPRQNKELMEALITVHGHQLRNIPCDDPNSSNKNLLEKSEEAVNIISKFTDWESASRDAWNITQEIFDQLRKLDSGQPPVAFVIDEFDFLFGVTMFKDRKNRWIHSSAFRMCRYFQNISSWKPASKLLPHSDVNNSLLVGATCKKYPKIYPQKKKYLTGSKNFPVTDEVKTDMNNEALFRNYLETSGVHMGTFDDQELDLILQDYEASGFITPLSEDVKTNLKFASGYRGHELHAMCRMI